MTGHDDTGDDELRAYLEGRIPEPGDGYWEEIDARLRAVELERGQTVSEISASSDTTREPGRPTGMQRDLAPDHDNSEATFVENDDASLTPRSRWGIGPGLAAAAALVLLLGVGSLLLLRGSGGEGDSVDVAVPPVATEVVSPAGEGDDGGEGDGSPDGEAAPQPAPTGEPVGPVSATSPLGVLRASVDDAATGAVGGGATAGPFCFAGDDALVVPVNEVVDRRGLLWMEIAPGGIVSFAAMQGESIVLTGEAPGQSDGVIFASPTGRAGISTQLPFYEVTLEEASARVGADVPLPLVDCAQEPIASRVATMFTLIDESIQAEWPPADSVLSSAGLGPIRIGMTVSELSAQLGVPLGFETIDGLEPGTCGWLQNGDAISPEVWIIIEVTSADDGIIRRVSVTDGRWATPSGMTVGVTEQTVLDTFPDQIESFPHEYVEGTYLTYQTRDPNDPNTVQFVNEFGTIAEIRVGDKGWVGLIEGCA